MKKLIFAAMMSLTVACGGVQVVGGEDGAPSSELAVDLARDLFTTTAAVILATGEDWSKPAADTVFGCQAVAIDVLEDALAKKVEPQEIADNVIECLEIGLEAFGEDTAAAAVSLAEPIVDSIVAFVVAEANR